MSTVWIVNRLEKNRNCDIIGVFNSLDKARTFKIQQENLILQSYAHLTWFWIELEEWDVS